MKWAKWICVAAAVGIWGGLSCAPSPIYNDYAGETFGMKITPKHTWKAAGTLTNSPAAIDGNLVTVARSDNYQAAAELTVDLQGNCVFKSVIIDHGQSQHGFARKVRIATSVDGKVFVNRYTAHGTRRVTHLLLPKPVLARHVRIQVITPGERGWAVAEVYVQ